MRQAVKSLLFFKVRDHNMKLVANVTHKTPPIRFHFSDGIGYTFNMIPGKHAKSSILGREPKAQDGRKVLARSARWSNGYLCLKIEFLKLKDVQA